MKTKIELTVEQLKAIFIAGSEFAEQVMEYNLDERDEITAPDFGDFIKEKLGIIIE